MWSMGGQWFGFAIQLGTSVVLMRNLGPEAIGLVGMALAITVFADQFKTLGMSQAVIQRKDLTYGEVNSLFWINVGVGFLLAGIIAALAPVMAFVIYGRDALLAIALALSVTYVFAGFSVQPNALLARAHRFKTIGIRNAVARAAASAVALFSLFFLDAGYWAVVILQVAWAFFEATLVWLAISWRPGKPTGFAAARDAVLFGARIQFGELFNVMARNVDYILIGAFYGAGPLGLYRGAYNLMLTPIRQIKTPMGSVVQPFMASVRGEPERYRAIYLATIAGMAHIGLPLLAGLFLYAWDLIDLTLGEEFHGAAPIFQFLAIAGVVQLVTTTAGWLCTTMERGQRYATMSMWAGLATVMTFFVGLPWGATGVAIAYAIGQVAMAPAQFWYTTRHTPVSMSDVGYALLRPLGVGACVAVPLWLLGLALDGAHSYVTVPVAVVAGAVAWVTVLWLWPQARREALNLLGVARKRQPDSSHRSRVEQRTASQEAGSKDRV